MAKHLKSAWYGVSAVAIGTGIFFLATNKGRLFKKAMASLKPLLSGAANSKALSVPNAPAAPNSPGFKGRTPSPENGHVRDVVASNPPPPDSGSNFTPQGDVHAPQQ